MKTIFIFSFLLFYSFHLYAQNNKIDFGNCLLLNKEAQIYQSRVFRIDKDKNKYLSELINNQTVLDTFVLQNLSNGNKSICLLKLDSQQNIEKFLKIAEGPNFNFFNFDIDINSDLVYSITFSDSIIVNNIVFYSRGGTDIIVLRYKNFSLINYIQIGGINDEGFGSDALTFDKKDNSFYLSGGYNITLNNNYPNYEIIIGTDTLKSNKGERFLTKFDSLGYPLWSKSKYGGAVFKIIGDDIYILGNAQTIDTIGDLPIFYSPNYITHFYLAKLDKQGIAKWVKKFGQGQIDGLSQFKDLKISNSNVYLSGEGSSNIETKFIFEGGTNLTGNASRDFFIACYDTSGNFKWNTISNSPGDEGLNSLYADSIGNLYGVGNFNQKMYFSADSLSTKGNQSLFVCSYDSVGKYRFSIAAGGADIDFGSAIAADNNGKIYIVGGVTSPECYFGNDTLHPPPGQSTMFISSLDSVPILQAPNAIWEVPKNNFSIYPNPAKDKLIITAGYEQEVTVSIANTLGQIVFTKNIYLSNKKQEIEIANLVAGLYYVTITNNNNRFTQKILIQK